MKYSYPVTLSEDSANGGYIVTCRDLPEVITQGDMIDEALESAADALDEAICGCINHGRDIPDPSAKQVGEYLISVPEMTVQKVKAYTKMKEKVAKTKKFHDDFFKKRRYFFEPIKEIFEAACLLDKAVEMHLEERYADAEKLIILADHWKIFHWCEILWGKEEPWLLRLRMDPERPIAPKNEDEIPKEIEKEVIKRDGYFCQYCRIPVIAPEVRKELRKFYPEALRWGPKNEERHGAFLAMELSLDHVIPKAVGGKNEVSNLVVACGPCNSAKYEYTLDELGLANPLHKPVDSEEYSKRWEKEWETDLNKCWTTYRKRNWDKEQWDGLTCVFRTDA